MGTTDSPHVADILDRMIREKEISAAFFSRIAESLSDVDQRRWFRRLGQDEKDQRKILLKHRRSICGDPVSGEHYVCGFHILVNYALLVCVLEPPTGLDRNVQDSLQGFFATTFIQLPTADPLRETATLDVLGKYAWNATQRSHVITAHHMLMEPEFHPRFALTDEIVSLSVGCEVLVPRAFNR